MKNNALFLLTGLVFTFISCGTTSQVAQSGGFRYNNSIYYSSANDNRQVEYDNDQKELESLQNSTKQTLANSTQYSTFDKNTGTKTIYVGDSNEVNIDYNPNITYSIVDDTESYQARLRKFDSPTYTINIETDYYNYYPWWDVRFSWYHSYYPYRYGPYHYGSYYYSPYYYDPYYYSVYDPFFYDPFYYGYHYRPYYYPYYAWHNPWWGPGYRPGYYPPHHPPHKPGVGPGPGAKPSTPNGIYYGKRNNSGRYTNHLGDGGASETPSYKPNDRRNTGSVTRRVSTTRNQSSGQQKASSSTSNTSRSKYTRKPANSSSSKSSVKASSNSRNNNSSTYRSNSSSSTYNRSSSTYRSSGYSNSSSGSSSGASRSGSSGGGSSYRRR